MASTNAFCRLLLWVAWDDVSGDLAMLEEPAPVNAGNLLRSVSLEGAVSEEVRKESRLFAFSRTVVNLSDEV